MSKENSQPEKDNVEGQLENEQHFTYDEEGQTVGQQLENDSVEALDPTKSTEAQAPQVQQDESNRGGGGNKLWIGISAVLAILLVIALVKPPFGGGSESVATVNGSSISKDKLYDKLVSLGGTQVLGNLITEELIHQEAKAASVTIPDADVDTELAKVTESLGSEEQLNSYLSQYGMTLEGFKEDIRINLTITKILEPKTNVTEEDVQEFYDANKDFLGSPEQVQASHILVETKEEADAILAELKQGGDFATIAEEKSIDYGSAANGGDLGYFARGRMVATFEEAAFALKVDEISEVVPSEHGFHIIKKTGEKAEVIPTFESEKDEIRLQLVAQEAGQLSQAWLAEIREKATIINKLEEEAAAAAKE